ncbi:MAG: FAD-binding oxidoreductase [Cyanobacteriota bacterium]|nr:FAD-binding oxidoreductase [Cyanobacteriota bacterium]
MLDKLKTIVGADNCYVWEEFDVIEREKISKAIAPPIGINCIIYPNNKEEFIAVIALAYKEQWPLLICGSGSKLSWGGLVEGAKVVVCSDRLHSLIEHAVGDLTVTVQAGMKFAELQQILAKTGQFLPLDPAYPDKATIGGIVATADTGSLRQRYRGVRDLLLGISFVRADGKIAKGGGRVVKNVAGYDLMKLLTGSYGTLGVITEVTLRTYPLPEASATAVLVGETDAISQASQTLLSSALTPVAFDLLSAQLVEELNLGKGMGLMVRFQTVTDSVKQQSDRLLELAEKLGLSANLSGNNEAELWQRLKQKMWENVGESEVVCKIGVIPTEAAVTLNKLESGTGLIHAGVGLGVLRFDSISIDRLIEMRRWCEERGGFLTVLSAPVEIKQNLDVWGYNGNGVDLMRKIKRQFDPQNILNPRRFF